MASSDGSMVCAMRWVSTNYSGPLPKRANGVGLLRWSCGPREGFSSPRSLGIKKKWAAGPLAPRSPTMDRKTPTQNSACAGSRKNFRSTEDPRSTPELQKAGGAAGRPRLFLVTGRRPIRRPDAPVLGTAGQPLEIRVIGHPFQHATEVVLIIRREPKFGAASHDRGQAVQCV